ncbi:NUP50 [Lepeophtheirus salmonis]|uniref:NUP50 n=1 Tax=Lepeophtheirus salmonis TaxID=72036 RepID=A0A7R8HAR6_LEPSM|nr:NUP50 [Lepeophtheirus salmonis]CAF2960725.1 NUP50 [Lepeophtheirus salmonis]
MATKKRSATRELNHDNWNDDEEKEEPGLFEQAGGDVLQARVIKKAKRRGVTAEESGFLLLLNPRPRRPSPMERPPREHFFGDLKKESSSTSSSAAASPIPLSELFKAKPGSWKCTVCDVSNESSADKCVACTTAKPGPPPPKAASAATKWTCDACMVPNAANVNECVCCQTKKPGSTASTPKSATTFGATSSGSGFSFGNSSKSGETSSFKFGVSSSTTKSEKKGSGFKFDSTASSTPSSGFKFGSSSTPTNAASTGFSFGSAGSKVESSSPSTGFKFGSSPSTTKTSSGFFVRLLLQRVRRMNPQHLQRSKGFKFETSSNSSTPSKSEVKFGSFSSDAEKKDVSKEENNGSKLNSKGKFTANLRALNRQVAKWVMSKVEENPNVLLSPIFDDYAKHLKDITDKYGTTTSPAQSKKDVNQPLLGAVFGSKDKSVDKVSFSTGSSGNSGFGNFIKPSSTEMERKKDEPADKSESFSSTTSSSLFSFGNAAATKSTFSFGNTASNSSSGFSFGKASTPVFSGAGSSSFFTGATATTPANNKTEESNNDNANEDEPPKVEVKTVEENDAKFSMRCKLYYKKEKDFVDRGLGTLHLKVLEDKKVQLLVRAETNLGNILLNILINEKITFNQRGNNLQFVTIPNPTIKGMPEGPVTMLVKVKTEAMAKELHAKIQEILKEIS